MLLTSIQKDFIISTFFKSHYAGGTSIANHLLDDGKCIVAGTKCIWFGEIVNYIKVSTSNNYIDCLVYEFSIEDFMRTDWYRFEYMEYIDYLSRYRKGGIISEMEEIMPLDIRRDLLIGDII